MQELNYFFKGELNMLCIRIPDSSNLVVTSKPISTVLSLYGGWSVRGGCVNSKSQAENCDCCSFLLLTLEFLRTLLTLSHCLYQDHPNPAWSEPASLTYQAMVTKHGWCRVIGFTLNTTKCQHCTI